MRERADAMTQNGKDSERFLQGVLKERRETLLPAIEEIHKAARDEGIELGREAYAPEAARAGQPARVRIELPVSGSYEQIVGFLSRLERSKQFLVVDEVSLGAGSDGEARLAIVVSAYYREAPAAGSAGA
jgi:Tfp pilus assembly protein PilO